MNKLFTKIIGVCLGLTMAVGVGVAVASTNNAKVAYAAISDSEASGLTVLTSSNFDARAEYVLKSTDGYYWNGVSGTSSSKWGGITKTLSSVERLTISGTWSDGFTIKDTTGNYLRATTGNMTWATTQAGTFKMGTDSASNPIVYNGTTNGLKVNGTSGIRLYTNLTYNASTGKSVALYKIPATKTLSSISVSGYKTEFTVGDAFSFGGTVTAHYSDNTTANVTSSATFSGYNMSVAGNYTVTASYTEGGTTTKTTTYGITVSVPTTPTISLGAASFSGYTGQSFSVTATFANLTSDFAWSASGAGSIDGGVSGTTGDSRNGTSTYSGTLTGAGTKTLSASGGGATTQNYVLTITQTTVSLNKNSTSIAQGKSETLTATSNAGSSFTWTSSNTSAATVAQGIVSVPSGATVGATSTITATSTVDTSVSATCTVTVSENPFASFTVVKSTSEVTTTGVYTFSNDGTHYIGNTVDSSYISYPITSSNPEDLGYFRFETATNGYYLKYVEKNPQTGAWEDKSSNKYINNSSSTSMTWSNNASSIWTLNATGSGDSARVYITNSSNSGRHLGLNGNNPSTATQVRAYASQNISSNLPVYIYEVPQNKLDGLTVSGQTTTFTAGSTFSLGNNAVLTAHYSSTGDTTDLSGGTISYKINNVSVKTTTVLNHDTHNGKSVVITYTDAAGDTASTASYIITVNYKPATGIVLNLDEASLSIGGIVTLTATVSDEYADENDVSWSTTSAEIASISAASGTKTITVTGVSDGSATITATANGYIATCDITVTADPILNLKDSGGNIINDETLEYFTGDTSIIIAAESENVISPVFNWSNEDDSVVTIDYVDEYCEVTIVGAGSSDVSVTVGALTRTVTFSITQSGVTSITLTSSVPSGELFDGTYKNTLTLTPAVTLVGNATGVINWSSSNTDVATVSSTSTTSPTAITVTGVGEGTATITARSAYTPSMSETFDVTVAADVVEELSWTNRPYFDSDASESHIQIFANDTTLAQIAAAGNSSYGTFTPTWASGKTEENPPTFGTGADNVHLVLSNTLVDSEAGLTPLSATSTFTKNDNGKYVIAFYHGVRAKGTTMPKITVINWRSVKETNTTSGTFDFSGGTAKGTSFTTSTLGQRYSDAGGLAAPTISGITALYDGNGSGGAIQGSGFARIGKSGSVTFTFPSGTEISSISMGLRSWSSTENCTISVTNCTSFTTSDGDYEQHTFTLSEATNVITISSNSARAFIDAITIVAGGEQEIGKTTECLGLEAFIDNYLHMDDYPGTEGQAGPGWCKDNEHDYYGKNTQTGAKAAFNALSPRQKSLFTSNSAYTAEWARLSAWAAANGESLNSSSMLDATRISLLANIVGNTNTIAVIVIISMISITAIGGYFFLRKRKEN